MYNEISYPFIRRFLIIFVLARNLHQCSVCLIVFMTDFFVVILFKDTKLFYTDKGKLSNGNYYALGIKTLRNECTFCEAHQKLFLLIELSFCFKLKNIRTI